MKLLGIFILHKEDDTKVKILQNEFNLDSFGWFERRHIEPVLVFSARTVIERTACDVKQSIKTDEKLNAMIHAYVRSDGLASVVISNSEYPTRVAYNLLSRVMENFTNMYPPFSWEKMAEKSGKMTSLNEMLAKYQNPEVADPMMSLQKDLDETRKIMIITMENILKRGENLDDLLARSADLDFQTRQYVRKAKDLNRCCTLF